MSDEQSPPKVKRMPLPYRELDPEIEQIIEREVSLRVRKATAQLVEEMRDFMQKTVPEQLRETIDGTMKTEVERTQNATRIALQRVEDHIVEIRNQAGRIDSTYGARLNRLESWVARESRDGRGLW